MIALVAAMDENRAIGLNGKMPWHLPNDLKHFQQVTTGGTVVMGRKTFESIGKPLKNRTNIILTRDRAYEAEGCEVIHDKEDIHSLAKDIYIIGGATIYEQFLPMADRMYLTFIEASFKGDTFFPQWDNDQFTILEVTNGNVDEKNRYPHRFVTFERIGQN
ncbi:dihydrofolate reductase [Salsuginibacillus kocurii]|uniref:dihydrofolate reductase n=1 Tax=Salsuginibacillus kocurii TaxID=427078 RepID=UPI000363AB77|nr:dihydrofolate reductase [Salsuginibacillus kocurii]